MLLNFIDIHSTDNKSCEDMGERSHSSRIHRRACLKRVMTVDVSKEICRDRSI